MTYQAISIRQPWAWLIVNSYKDVENRSWKTNFRGPLLVHASRAMSLREYEDVQIFLDTGRAVSKLRIKLPSFKEIQLGGIVGSVTVADCSRSSQSP